MKTSFFFVLLTVIFFSCSNKQINNPDTSKTDQIESIINKVGDSLTTKVKKAGYEDIDFSSPGVVIALWSDELNFNYIKSFGVSDIETNEPMKNNILFRIGSITKTFVITVFLQLVDEKKVSLDDKLQKFFPDFQRSDEVTLRQLCNMTSGIFNFWETEAFVEWITNHPEKPITPLEVISWVKDVPFYFNPGTGIHYSNTNTYLLSLIIEQITGNKIEDEVKTRLIDKLHLNNTFFPTVISFPAGIPYSKGYIVDADNKIKKDYTDFLTPCLSWSAGAMISNIEDIKIWIEACAGGSLISDSTHQERKKTIAWDEAKMSYGLGIMEYKGFWGHGGNIMGYSTVILRSPERKTTIAVMINSSLDQLHPVQEIVDCYLSL